MNIDFKVKVKIPLEYNSCKEYNNVSINVYSNYIIVKPFRFQEDKVHNNYRLRWTSQEISLNYLYLKCNFYETNYSLNSVMPTVLAFNGYTVYSAKILPK